MFREIKCDLFFIFCFISKKLFTLLRKMCIENLCSSKIRYLLFKFNTFLQFWIIQKSIFIYFY